MTSTARAQADLATYNAWLDTNSADLLTQLKDAFEQADIRILFLYFQGQLGPLTPVGSPVTAADRATNELIALEAHIANESANTDVDVKDAFLRGVQLQTYLYFDGGASGAPGNFRSGVTTVAQSGATITLDLGMANSATFYTNATGDITTVTLANFNEGDSLIWRVDNNTGGAIDITFSDKGGSSMLSDAVQSIGDSGEAEFTCQLMNGSEEWTRDDITTLV